MTTLTLSHCGFMKDRSDETRVFLDDPDDFAQFSFKNSLDGGSSDKPTASTQNDHFEQSHQEAQKRGAVLLFSSKDHSELQYNTKFLTENDQIDPLRGKNNKVLTLSELQEVDETLNFPSGSDLGTYIFHRNATLKGKENKLYTLPTHNIESFGIDKEGWAQAWDTLSDECDGELQAALVRSEVVFDIDNVSFQDFDIDPDYLVEEGDAATFRNLEGIVQKKLLEAFKPNLKDVQGTVDGEFAFCMGDAPGIYRFNGKNFVDAKTLENVQQTPRSVFERMVNKDYLKRIALAGDKTLSELRLGDDYRLFNRDSYRHIEVLQIPAMDAILTAIETKSSEIEQAQTTDSKTSSPTASAKEDAQPEVQVEAQNEGYTELQKMIMSRPKRASRPSTSVSESPKTVITLETTPVNPPKTLEKGDVDEFTELVASYSELNPQLVTVTTSADTHLPSDPFASLLLKRTSRLFYDDEGQYMQNEAWHVYDEASERTFTPNSSMWDNDKFFTPTFDDATVKNDTCDGYPIVRNLTFNVDVHAPDEFTSKQPYMTLDLPDGPRELSYEHVVADQIWVDANPHEKVIDVLMYGAFGKREQDPIKDDQHTHLRICFDPSTGDLLSFWKSSETSLMWNDEVKWKSKYAKNDKFLKQALRGEPSEILKPNPTPWHQSVSDHAVDTQSAAFQTLYALAQSDPEAKNVIDRHINQPHTAGHIVCSDVTQSCYLVFQATFRRAFDPRIMAFYVTHPSVWFEGGMVALEELDFFYNEMFKSMLKAYDDYGQIRKNQVVFYGAVELNMEEGVKDAEFISLKTLHDNGILTLQDANIHHDGSIAFPGETPDLEINLTVN